MPAVDRLFGQMTRDAQEVGLKIFAERLIGKNENSSKSVQEILGRHGYQFIGDY